MTEGGWVWWSWRFGGEATWERKGKKEILSLLGCIKKIIECVK